jgi:hypothetical protein
MRIGTWVNVKGGVAFGWCLLVSGLVLTGCSPSTPSDGTTTDDGTVTIQFEGAEGTGAGTTTFTHEGAMFTGGTVRSLGQPDLYASGQFAYEVLPGSPVTVTFDEPIEFLELFLASSGNGLTVLTALDAEGRVLGLHQSSPAGNASTQEVTLSGEVTSVVFIHTGDDDGWIDDFSFRVAQPS